MAGIVLAGGRSERMGRDKALLQIDGISLVERAAQTLRAVADTVIVVADRPNKYVFDDGTPVLGDKYPGMGPLGGLLTGLDAAGAGCHFALACDMPFVQPELL